MVVIDDHDMIDTGEGSIPRDVSDTCEGSIPRGVFDVGEGSIPIDVQDVNIESTEGQEQIDLSDIESYRNDPDFAPTPKGTPSTLRRADSTSVSQGSNDTRVKKGDTEDGGKDGKRKRKRKTVSKVTNCPAKIGLKAIPGIECYKLFDFVENHNHPLMNENNMDLSRARRQLHFGDYIFIHRASLSNIGPTLAHRLKVALMGGYDKVRETPVHRKQPPLALTDQDAALRNVVVKTFPNSKHRLCMCHITQKLPGKVLGEQVVVGHGSKRRKSAAEEGKAQRKPRTTGKVPFKKRTCSKCGGKGHNRRGCTKKRKTTKATIDDEDKVIGEDEVDEEDDVQEVDAEDKVQEVDEDYESDEEASDEDASDEDESDEDYA
ncbi:FAR1-related sequence 5-like protein [Tanacetum coccineum]